MGRVLRCIIAVLAVGAFDALAQADANLQRLLDGLTQGTEVTLVTPLGNGFSEVVSFTPPGRLLADEAAAALESARRQLLALGVAQPTGRQFAAALLGGTLAIPTGSTQLPGVLPLATQGTAIRSQLVASPLLPQAQLPATGAALSHAEVAQALQLATTQLAMHGILHPTPEQINVAMFGGTIVPPAGPTIVLPGVVAATPPAPSMTPSLPRPSVVQPSARPVVPAR